MSRMNNTIGIVHVDFMSKINPVTIGPNAANRYPADWDIPESCAALEELGLLREINAIDSEILPPIPIDISTTATVMNAALVPKRKHAIPAT